MYKVVEFPETPRSAKRRIRSQSYTRTWKFGSKAQLKEREDPICNSRMRVPSGQDSAGLLPVQSNLSKEPTLNSNPSLSPRTENLSASAEIATRQHKDTNPESPTAGEVIHELIGLICLFVEQTFVPPRPQPSEQSLGILKSSTGSMTIYFLPVRRII